MKWPHWIVVVIIAVVAFACPTKGQTITLSGQGSEALRNLTGRRIPGFQLVGVTACAPNDRPIEFSGGRVYEAAAKAGFKWSGTEVASVNLARNATLNWRNLAIFIARTGSSALTVAAGGGILSIGAQGVAGLALGHQFMDDGIQFVQGRVPDPQPVVKRIFEAESRYSLTPNGCIGGYIGSAFPSGPISAVTVAMDAPSPAWFDLAVSHSVGTALADQLAALERRMDQIQGKAARPAAVVTPAGTPNCSWYPRGQVYQCSDNTVFVPNNVERPVSFEHSRDLWEIASGR